MEYDKLAKTEGSTWIYIHKEGKVKKTQVKHIRVITGGRKITKGGRVNHEKTQEEKTFKMKQEITNWKMIIQEVNTHIKKRRKRTQNHNTRTMTPAPCSQGCKQKQSRATNNSTLTSYFLYLCFLYPVSVMAPPL